MKIPVTGNNLIFESEICPDQASDRQQRMLAKTVSSVSSTAYSKTSGTVSKIPVSSSNGFVSPAACSSSSRTPVKSANDGQLSKIPVITVISDISVVYPVTFGSGNSLNTVDNISLIGQSTSVKLDKVPVAMVDKSVQVNTIEDHLMAQKIPTIVDLITNTEQLYAWTGLSSFDLIDAIEEGFNFVYPDDKQKRFELLLKERIYLILIKMKTNLAFINISTLFGVSRSTISRNFQYMVPRLEKVLSPALYFPEIGEIRKKMPKCFKPNFTTVRTVFDCTEIEIPQLKCLKCRIVCYSHYKGRQTIKYLIGITPGGFISYLSPAYCGKASDKFIFNNENVINRFEPYIDSIMSDKGFHVEKECSERGINLIRPHFLRNKTQFSKSEAKKNDDVAKSRVHVERSIQRFKEFDILTQKVDRNLLPYMDSLARISASVVNMSSPILADIRF